MTDPALRKQTASEFLSIEEEHEMQRKWYLDDDSEHTAYNILARANGHAGKLILTSVLV